MGPDVFLALLCLGLMVGIGIQVLYLRTLQKALNRVSVTNRLIEPRMLWFALIPLVHTIWNFLIPTWIPDSLRNEFIDRGEDDGTDYGKGIGFAFAICQVLLLPFSLGIVPDPTLQRIIRLPLGLVCLVLLIQFWVKIAVYSNRLTIPPNNTIRTVDPRTVRPQDMEKTPPTDS